MDQKQLSKLVEILSEEENVIIYKEGSNVKVFKLTPLDKEIPEAKKPEDETVTISAPSAGIFYRRPEPDAPPYVEEGSLVEPGDILGLIEVMKSFGPITSQVKGRVIKILAEDAKPVEYGQPLFLIKKE